MLGRSARLGCQVGLLGRAVKQGCQVGLQGRCNLVKEGELGSSVLRGWGVRGRCCEVGQGCPLKCTKSNFHYNTIHYDQLSVHQNTLGASPVHQNALGATYSTLQYTMSNLQYTRIHQEQPPVHQNTLGATSSTLQYTMSIKINQKQLPVHYNTLGETSSTLLYTMSNLQYTTIHTVLGLVHYQTH